MPPTDCFIDANLLVLLVVGGEDRELITKHRRLKGYTGDDYDLLRRLIENAGRVLVTPNTLTEASNLLAQHGEPERSRILERLRRLIHESEEIVVSSARAAAHGAYIRLGLTDAALIEAATAETPVITADLGLYVAASRADPDAALNFTHYRGM